MQTAIGPLLTSDKSIIPSMVRKQARANESKFPLLLVVPNIILFLADLWNFHFPKCCHFLGQIFTFINFFFDQFRPRYRRQFAMPSMARLQPQSQLSLFIFHHSHVSPSLGHLLISFFLCSYFLSSRVFLHDLVASAILVRVKKRN